MKKRSAVWLYKSVIAIVLAVALAVGGVLPVSYTDTVISARAASSVKDVKLTLKKTDNGRYKLSASWSGNSGYYNYKLYYRDMFDGWGDQTGSTLSGSVSMNIDDMKEGWQYTLGVDIYEVYSDGSEGDKVSKTKTFFKEGKYTKKIKNLVNKNCKCKSAFKKIRYAHDWLVKNIDYDTNYNPESHNFDSTMKNKKGVCQGYTAAFYVFMKYAGITSDIVLSSNEQHAWNMVKLGKKWYHVDVTWDDPVGMEEYTKKYPIYNNFLQSTKSIRKKGGNDHKFNTSDYKKAKDKTYDNKGGLKSYKETIPGNQSYYSTSTFHPWKNGKTMK